ncbi:glycosyltransferase [Kineococcus sp. T13]|uniref:glycosyltransferase n=1 Tax=Kineococcus vitellinus TaxID=2696565 RepID=UPI00141367A0|nr:glycosyltransferase [Kineococcus vitellinus]
MAVADVFISGCYIVKDEEELLGASLESIKPYVDEVIVYDTGSQDRTVAIAEAAGARVVRGYWDEDFGAARNRALEHCSGEWLLCVDADEQVRGDARAWRRSLRLTNADNLLIEQVSDSWGGAGSEIRIKASRVLRRATCRWEGALHEQVVGRWGQVQVEVNEDIHLDHGGYSVVRLGERSKGERNLRVAQAALVDGLKRGSGDITSLRVDVLRSAALAGDHRHALSVLKDIDPARLTPAHGLLLAHTVIDSSLRTQQSETARTWLELMRGWGEDESTCLTFEARIAGEGGDWKSAESLLRAAAAKDTGRGSAFGQAHYRDALITALARQGRAREAVDMLIEHLPTGRTSLPAIPTIELVNEVPGAMARFVRALPAALEIPYVAQLQVCVADFAADFYGQLWTAGRARHAILAAVGNQWPSMTFNAALSWSLRYREAGLASSCPLRRMLLSEAQDAETRILCGAVLHEIGERDHLDVLEELLAGVADEAIPPLLERLRQVAPAFAASLVPA